MMFLNTKICSIVLLPLLKPAWSFLNFLSTPLDILLIITFQPRSQGLFPGLGAGREKALASAGHVSSLHPEILGVIN